MHAEIFHRLRGFAWVGRILVRVGVLVVKVLDETIKGRGEDSSQHRPEPVDPMVPWKRPCRYGATKAVRRVKGGSSIGRASVFVSRESYDVM